MNRCLAADHYVCVHNRACPAFRKANTRALLGGQPQFLFVRAARVNDGGHRGGCSERNLNDRALSTPHRVDALLAKFGRGSLCSDGMPSAEPNVMWRRQFSTHQLACPGTRNSPFDYRASIADTSRKCAARLADTDLGE